jgi:predicted RNA-binding Zn ribbon-like protein
MASDNVTARDVNATLAATVNDFNAKMQERLELTDDDRRLIARLDPDASAPLVAMLRREAPQMFGDSLKGQRVTPEQAEEFLEHIIHGAASHSEQRRRGQSRWGQLRSMAQASQGIADTAASRKADGGDKDNDDGDDDAMMDVTSAAAGGTATATTVLVGGSASRRR